MLKLKEGNVYKFLVEKELSLPDNTIHFLLKGPDLKKYLIPAQNYLNYGLIPGNTIKCRIDRINCNGKVFLEPRNPWYSEGKSYNFRVDGIEVRTDKKGINHNVVIVKDRSGNKISVLHNPSDPYPPKGTLLKLTVERITKGKLHLLAMTSELGSETIKIGKSYEFVIERIEKGMDEEEYFVVKDPFGDLHTISRKFYEYYGYSLGTRFKGKIIKNRNNSEYAIEPENPFYKPGSVIKMTLTGFTENIVNPSFTINLMDSFGFTHCIETATLPAGKKVRCRIVMIKKGKPLLELL
jgi:hypothetical protein